MGFLVLQVAFLLDSAILAGVDPVVRDAFAHDVTTAWLPDKRMGPVLYRGSVDGMTARVFHSKCDGKGPTLTLIRSADGSVFGGYVGCHWKQFGGYQYSEGAFLFSIVGPFVTGHALMLPLNPGLGSAVMACDAGSGPSFGFTDLVIGDFASRDKPFEIGQSSLGFSYTDVLGQGGRTFTGTTTFVPVEIEVYRVL